ncbi:cell wall elongation regulator TseB-like domain-containing protein [Kurthia sibirica]|uniref:Cell wall elongation regulator TseB-like domain-containing protein n=1 Tax=Kurthia sibirica TaxID=202750 RepID=A0A2U3AI77_9BACL|nr:DUF5590 domain-containing protein [Kurthia sibirica]PWI24235.1 hypothetical protein DEX24_14560 [Kurthia sibirica]GEK34134.1 hypothetical protein KSI01_16670 [Kurthia sibirica]
MKNWIKFFSVFLVILAVVLTAIITFIAYLPFSSATSKAEKAVLSDQLITEVSDSYVYNSKTSYVTVIGKDQDNKKLAVFKNEDDPQAKMQKVELKKGISKKEAIKIATKDQKVKKVMHARLGVEKPGIVWEVTFKSTDDKLNYVYIMFDDGQWWKKITNL